jgi:hypothetical protein
LEPKGRLCAEDFDAVATTLDQVLENDGELRGIVVHAESLPGWANLGALLRHRRFVSEHRGTRGRTALAVNGPLGPQGPLFMNHFTQVDAKRFAFSDVDAAIRWAADASPSSRWLGNVALNVERRAES